MIQKIGVLAIVFVVLVACGTSQSEKKQLNSEENKVEEMTTIKINNIDFNVKAKYQFFNWENIPSGLKYQRNPLVEFTNTNGDTHYYELVYISRGTLNWYQAAYLADAASGYLASVTSKEENDFLFNMVNDKKYFWKFPKYIEGRSKGNHYEIMIGPMLGGFKHNATEELLEGWQWLSGEKWEYTNWAQNIDDGVVDKDPRDNTQPNNSGEDHSQRTIGFGEMNQPVPTWGDYSDDVGTYGLQKTGGERFAFIIEYNQKPHK